MFVIGHRVCLEQNQLLFKISPSQVRAGTRTIQKMNHPPPICEFGVAWFECE